MSDERPAYAGYSRAEAEESVLGNRHWWDAAAADYLEEHGAFLAARCIWGPEGLDEAEAGLLGPLNGRDVLELGAGAAQCSTWVKAQGARVCATDLSSSMLRAADGDVPRLQVDARRLPFSDSAFDIVFSAYGAVPFVADPERIMHEAARVLRPGGRWVFSITHPIRWAFPDDPGRGGLTATRSYFDLTPYVERDDAGRALYAEHHRTFGQRIAAIRGAGLNLIDVIEPLWPEDLLTVWGGWSPLRGRLLPGTAIFVTQKPE